METTAPTTTTPTTEATGGAGGARGGRGGRGGRYNRGGFRGNNFRGQRGYRARGAAPAYNREGAEAAGGEPVPLAKPEFLKVKMIEPGTRGLNLLAKVLAPPERKLERARPDGSTFSVGEAVIGDETGTVRMTLRNQQLDLLKDGASIVVRNAQVQMFESHVRIEVDRWGKISEAETEHAFEVNEGHDVSAIEYELVNVE
eukprot:GHVO01004503.1.p1 GENE.GHVO01004503.1~~GHVO01004503.1.p1  ORF type:complete len:200 (+),score=22.23 GHVO01004503.1:68-667(+)